MENVYPEEWNIEWCQMDWNSGCLVAILAEDTGRLPALLIKTFDVTFGTLDPTDKPQLFALSDSDTTPLPTAHVLTLPGPRQGRPRAYFRECE
jgi:hypothetical protein